MAESGAEKRLFIVRVYPEGGPLSLVIRLATSTREAEDFAMEKTGFTEASTKVTMKVDECPLDEAMFISIGGHASD
jgi:hypothetical protein